MKRIISFLLTAVILASVIVACVIPAGAVTYVTFGDYDLVVKSSTTYLIGGYHGEDTSPVFPDSANGKDIVGVAEDFYDNCSAELVSVTMPDSFTVVESFAFFGMTSLETVILSSNISSIGAMAFSGCTSLSDINLGDTVITTVSNSCFSNCGALKSVVLPEELKTVGNYAFSKSGLESVDLPGNVTSIGSFAFNECASLANVSLPYGLSSIGDSAFYNDVLLTSVFVPGTVTQIGGFCFNPMAIEGGTLTVECFEDTYAAQYAHDNFLNVSAVEKLIGDVNDDGKININDVTYIQLYRVKLYDINSSKAIELSDVNKDGSVTLRDSTMIQMLLAGIITEF